MPDVPGNNPCAELQTRGGTWRYDANRLDQHFSPAERFVTGLRNGKRISFDTEGRIFATQHGRDQLGQNWPKLCTLMQNAQQPAEELTIERQGADFGWPECYYDRFQHKLVLAPEYGGDGAKAVGVCAKKDAPVAAFPAHWAPNDMLI
jgi:glucose/arabinose dehydrogenase